MKEDREGKFLAYFFFFAGIIACIAAFIAIIYTHSRTKDFIKTDGWLKSEQRTVVRDNVPKIHNYIFIDYYVGDIKYTLQTGMSSQVDVKQGTRVEVKYNPENPSDAVTASVFNGGRYLVLFCGFFAAIIGAFLLVAKYGWNKIPHMDIFLLCAMFGGIGAVFYGYIGHLAGSFHPVKIVQNSLWALAPMLFIIVALFGIIVFVIGQITEKKDFVRIKVLKNGDTILRFIRKWLKTGKK